MNAGAAAEDRAGPVLAIVERAWRGTVEKQYFDTLYMAVELHRQLGGLEVLLRGPAVTYAVHAPPPRALKVGDRGLETAADPRRDLRALLAGGIPVLVAEEDLRAVGFGPGDLLDPGLRTLAPGALVARWERYRAVCFL